MPPLRTSSKPNADGPISDASIREIIAAKEQLLIKEYERANGKTNEERLKTYRAQMAKVGKLEAQVQQLLGTLEQRELRIASGLEEIRKHKQMLDDRDAKRAHECVERIQRVKEDASMDVKREIEKREEVESRNKELKVDLERLRSKWRTLEDEMHDANAKTRGPAFLDVQAELAVVKAREEELRRQNEQLRAQLDSSKQHVRQLETALMEERSKFHAELTRRIMSDEEVMARRKSIAMARDDLEIESKPKAPPPKPQKPQPAPEQPQPGTNEPAETPEVKQSTVRPTRPNVIEVDEETANEIRRLTQEKEILLRTGAYTKDDYLVKEIDRRVAMLCDESLAQSQIKGPDPRSSVVMNSVMNKK